MEYKFHISTPTLVAGSLVLIACLSVLFIGTRQGKSPNKETESPFQISIDEVRTFQEPQQVFQNDILVSTGAEENRLIISVSINNSSKSDLKNVWFCLQLNPEAEPYIASHILKFTSDKMDITTSEKALTSSDQSKPVICGFLHAWNMTLTTREDLETYYALSPSGLQDALKSITVTVKWDGGLQEETIPIAVQ